MSNGNFVRAQVILGTNLYRDVLKACLRDGTPMSEYIGRVLQEHLKRQEEHQERTLKGK